MLNCELCRDLFRKQRQPRIFQGLRNGAGEEGRTPDLMLGKHTL